MNACGGGEGGVARGLHALGYLTAPLLPTNLTTPYTTTASSNNAKTATEQHDMGRVKGVEKGGRR